MDFPESLVSPVINNHFVHGLKHTLVFFHCVIVCYYLTTLNNVVQCSKQHFDCGGSWSGRFRVPNSLACALRHPTRSASCCTLYRFRYEDGDEEDLHFGQWVHGASRIAGNCVEEWAVAWVPK